MKAKKVLDLFEVQDTTDLIKNAPDRGAAALTFVGAVSALVGDMAQATRYSSDQIVQRIKQLMAAYNEKFPIK